MSQKNEAIEIDDGTPLPGEVPCRRHACGATCARAGGKMYRQDAARNAPRTVARESSDARRSAATVELALHTATASNASAVIRSAFGIGPCSPRRSIRRGSDPVIQRATAADNRCKHVCHGRVPDRTIPRRKSSVEWLHAEGADGPATGGQCRAQERRQRRLRSARLCARLCVYVFMCMCMNTRGEAARGRRGGMGWRGW